MDGDMLTKFYDNLKSKLEEETPADNTIRVGGAPLNGTMEHPGVIKWRRKAANEAEKLKDTCRKHIILDIYCNILPLDQDYISGNKCQMKLDIDNMLNQRNMTPTQYLTSCFEATHAPLLEFILRSTDNIGKQFMEEANETLKDAQENDISVPEPTAPVEEDEIEGQLVDVKNDTEYSTFIDKLKQKTIDKIVDDVSKIINNKKEEKEMTFDTTPEDEAVAESTVGVCMDYIENKLMTENVEVDSNIQEEIIGMAIRESTMNQIDIAFNLPNSSFRNFASRIRLGKGAVLNESAITYLTEKTQ